MKRVKNIDVMTKVLLVLFGAVLVTNPLTGQYILEGLMWGFEQVFNYGAYVGVVFGAYMLFYLGVKYAMLNKVNIPKKTAKTKTQNYIK